MRLEDDISITPPVIAAGKKNLFNLVRARAVRNQNYKMQKIDSSIHKSFISRTAPSGLLPP